MLFSRCFHGIWRRPLLTSLLYQSTLSRQRAPCFCVSTILQNSSSSSSSSTNSSRLFATSTTTTTSSSSGTNSSTTTQQNENGSTTTTTFSNQLRGGKTLQRRDEIVNLMGDPLQEPAGPLWGPDIVDDDDDDHDRDHDGRGAKGYIPEVSLYLGEGGRSSRKRILILCTGGTLTMAPDPNQGGALAPVQGAISRYMKDMTELHSSDDDGMPEYVLHEYSPFRDSSDLGPADWATLAKDIRANYLHFDGFVVLTGTDTMAYCATALSFMLENLGKPVVFTGSQIPLSEPYNDARRNLIMAMIFASRDGINEVSIFFHDRLLRANRATKVNTHRLLAFDSPNLDPLATIGITIDENEHLVLPAAKGALKVHTQMDTRLLTIRLVPGFDDEMIRYMIQSNVENDKGLKALVLQLYGTGNIPSVKESFIQLLADAQDQGILVIAATQCFTGNVMLGHYATGRALQQAGVISAADMTLEAIACKSAYLLGRQDLTIQEIGELMTVSLRGEITPAEALSPPPLSSAYQQGIRKGKKYY